MKLKVQAQHLQPGDIVGSGEKVLSVQIGINTTTRKCEVRLEKDDKIRFSIWGKYTMINVERAENA